MPDIENGPNKFYYRNFVRFLFPPNQICCVGKNNEAMWMVNNGVGLGVSLALSVEPNFSLDKVVEITKSPAPHVPLAPPPKNVEQDIYGYVHCLKYFC